MNLALSGGVSLNVPLDEEGDLIEMQDLLVDEHADPKSRVAESGESGTRRKVLGLALKILNHRERRILEARRLVDPPLTLEELAAKFSISRERSGKSNIAPSKRSRTPVIRRAAFVRTARKIMSGLVYVPGSVWSGQEAVKPAKAA